MPRFQYTGLELISQFILSERLGPSPRNESRLYVLLLKHTYYAQKKSYDIAFH